MFCADPTVRLGLPGLVDQIFSVFENFNASKFIEIRQYAADSHHSVHINDLFGVAVIGFKLARFKHFRFQYANGNTTGSVSEVLPQPFEHRGLLGLPFGEGLENVSWKYFVSTPTKIEMAGSRINNVQLWKDGNCLTPISGGFSHFLQKFLRLCVVFVCFTRQTEL